VSVGVAPAPHLAHPRTPAHHPPPPASLNIITIIHHYSYHLYACPSSSRFQVSIILCHHAYRYPLPLYFTILSTIIHYPLPLCLQ
jgi:hypothetical protein